MVDFPINEGVRKIADSILTVTAKNANEEWFAADIIPKLSSASIIAPIVVDFSFSASSVIEYTLDSGNSWSAFNNGSAIDGGQSIFIRVTNNVQLNFRAVQAGNLIRAVVSTP